MNKKIIQSIIALFIGFFLLTLADLIPFWMPMMGEMLMLLLATVLLLLWAGFIMFEEATDEREVHLKSQSGRIAYLAGLGMLLIALIFQGVAHTIDPWIPVALLTMVFAKLFARHYLE